MTSSVTYAKFSIGNVKDTKLSEYFANSHAVKFHSERDISYIDEFDVA